MTTCVKICRDCGEEYRREALRCADCGGELEERFLDESGDLVPAGGQADDDQEDGASAIAEHRVVFLTPRAADLVPLAEALREQRVPYRLAEQSGRGEGAPSQYALLVPEAEAGTALAALGPLLSSEDGAADLAQVETRFEAGRGYTQCPACGAARPPGAEECPECGLALSDTPATCARCGAPLGDAEEPCRACLGAGGG